MQCCSHSLCYVDVYFKVINCNVNIYKKHRTCYLINVIEKLNKIQKKTNENVQQYIAFVFVSKRFLDAVSKFVNKSIFFYSKTKSHLPL